MGIHKPWSPSRSYGLVVKLDAQLRPVASFHSRANGRRHGVTAVAEVTAGGYRIRRSSDGQLLPTVFTADEVRREHRRGQWWY